MPHTKHRCSLNIGSNSMLPKNQNDYLYSRLSRNLRKLTLASYLHPFAHNYFKSYPACVAERQRQVIEGGYLIIHPISLFSLGWDIFMLIVNFAHMIAASFRFCLVLQLPGGPTVTGADCLILALDVACLLDIVVKFNTGYFKEDQNNAVMNRQRIAQNYLRHYLIPDLLSSLPIAYGMLASQTLNLHALMFAHLLPVFRSARIYTVLINLKKFLRIVTHSYIFNRSAHHFVLFVLLMHWLSCFVYFGPVCKSYWKNEEAYGYNFFWKKKHEPLSKYSMEERYLKALFICVSAFFGTGFSLLHHSTSDEMLTNSLITLLSSAFMVYSIVFLLKIYMTHYNSSIRYHELMDQVEKYMRHKQFPAPLKKRVLEFYQYRYHEQYFKEDEAMECLSVQLRHEINLHTCHKLVEKVELFRGVSASRIGSILGCLKPEVYMPNDLVVRAGDYGQCMYFIANGTVVVLSLKGAEVCHLEDGCHFGEVALLMKDSKRVATVIAIETTLVYRLDALDFRRFIATDKELLAQTESIATQRMHETVVLDEAYQRTRTGESALPAEDNLKKEPSANQKKAQQFRRAFI